LASREVRQLVSRLEAAGYRVTRGASGHIKVYDPGGAMISSLPSSPSDHRSLKNGIAQLRRKGAPV
jgi:hypothetical protein